MRPPNLMVCFVLFGMSSVLQAEERNHFDRVDIPSDYVRRITGLNIYKFEVDLPESKRFRLILRELRADDEPARVLVSHEFEKRDNRNDKVTIVVSFLREDGILQGVLDTQEERGELRVETSGVMPVTATIGFEMPLRDIPRGVKKVVPHRTSRLPKRAMIGLSPDELRLLSIVVPVNDSFRMNQFPRAELVIDCSTPEVNAAP